MLKVGLDTSAISMDFKSHAVRGTGRYVQELLSYFKDLDGRELKLVGFDQESFFDESFINKLIAYLPCGRSTLRQQLLYPFKLRAIADTDFLHFPAHIDAPTWSSKKFIVTVLDLIPVVLSELYGAKQNSWRFRLARWLELRTIVNAALVLTISENTAEDVHRVLGVPYERIVVTPLGVDESFFTAELFEDEPSLRKRYGILEERDIVLYVGGIDQRKNMKGLLGAFAKLLEMKRTAKATLPVLVMVGDISGDAEYPELLKLQKELALEEDIVMTGYVEDKDLLQIYKIASVFFFPSLYEGFGLPPLEAMAAGTPVVSSNTSSIPEVLGDAALAIDPENYNLAAKELCQVLDDDDLARDLSARGQAQAKKFPWSKTGELTISAYQRLAEKS